MVSDVERNFWKKVRTPAQQKEAERVETALKIPTSQRTTTGTGGFVSSPHHHHRSSSGGRSSSSSNAAKKAVEQKRKAAEVARKEREIKGRIEQKAREKAARIRTAAQQQKIKKEQARINELKKNAKKNEVVVRDRDGNIKRVENTYYKNGNKVIERINYVTGKTYTETYVAGKLTGGLNTNISSRAENTKIKSDLKKSGLIPVTNKYGQVVGFKSDITKKSYSYTDAGINAFNKDMKTPGAKFRQMVKDDLATGMSVTKTPKSRVSKTYEKYVINPAIGLDKIKNEITWVVKKTFNKTGINIKKQDFDFIAKAVETQLKYMPWLKKDIKKKVLLSNEVKKITENTLKKIPEWKRISETRLSNIPTQNKNAFIKISNEIRKNPNLSEKQIQEKIKNKMTRQTIMDGIEGASLLLNVAVSSAINAAYQLGIATPTLVRGLIKNPFLTIAMLPPTIGGALLNDSIVIGKTISPTHKGSPIKVVELIGEYYAFGKIFKKIGEVKKATAQKIFKLSSKYVKEVNGRWVLRKTPEEIFNVRGKKRYLESRVQKPSITRPFTSAIDFLKGRKSGQFKKWTKDAGLELKTQTAKSGAMDFAKQFKKYSGKEITAINAAKNQLTSFIRRGKIIRKPISDGKNFGGEKFAGDYSSFPNRIGALIKKFDQGKKLNAKEFIEVNKWLQKNVASNITLLERSLYADPAGGFRVSRLGITKEVSPRLRDLFKGNYKISFKNKKPQVLIFEKAKVAKAPKYIQKIVNKFGKTKKISDYDLYQLVEWQTKSGTGLFKAGGSPIYAGGRELEVTLAPGEMIKRIKKVGFTYINGKKITFVTAEVFKPTKAILRKMKMAENGDLTKAEVGALEKTLSKKLGRKIQVESKFTTKRTKLKMIRERRRLDPNIPVIRIRGTSLFVLSARGRGLKSIKRKLIKRPAMRHTKRKLSRKLVKRKPVSRKLVKRKPVSRKLVKRKPVSRKLVKRKPVSRKLVKRKPVSRKLVKRKPVSRPTGKPSEKPAPGTILPKKFTKRKLSKAQPTYYVVTKRHNRMVKLTAKPMTKLDARDYLAYNIDNGLERSAFIIPYGKYRDVIKLPSKIKGYYSKNKRKLRPYKIRHGKKKRILSGYVEKRKYLLDTAREKSQIKRAKRKVKKVIRKPIRRNKIKRKMTLAQRKVMLKNLEKARAAKRRK